MSDWLIIIHISNNVKDDIIFRYDDTSDMTVHALYKKLFNYMENERTEIVRDFNLRFNRNHGTPINWELTDEYHSPLNLDHYIWPNHKDITHNKVINLYKTQNQNDDGPTTLPPIAANVMTFPSKAAPTAFNEAPSASTSRSKNLRTVLNRVKRKEYVSKEELQDYRDLLITLNQETEQYWKQKYTQKLIDGNVGIGISGQYDDFMATVYDRLGFEVTDLTNSGAAKNAGIKVGDRILYVDGNACSYSWEFKYYILGKPSSQINLNLERGGQNITLKFNRNSSIDASENLELNKFVQSNVQTSLGGNRKRISKKGFINRKHISKKTGKIRKRLSKIY